MNKKVQAKTKEYFLKVSRQPEGMVLILDDHTW